MEQYKSLEEWRKANLKEYNKANKNGWLADICEVNGWHYAKSRRFTNYPSEHTYEEIMTSIKGNQELITFLKKLFDKGYFIKSFDKAWKWDFKETKFAIKNPEKEFNYSYDDAWEMLNIETNFLEYLTEGNKIILNDGRYIVLVPEENTIAIYFLEPKNREEGKVDAWDYKTDDTTDLDLHLHSKKCKCDKYTKEDLECYTRHYNFSYRFQDYRATIYPCMVSGNGIPHTVILDEAIKRIKNKLNIPCRPHRLNISSDNEGSVMAVMHRESDGRAEDNNMITEIVSTGGFNKAYYVKHNISKIDVDHIMKQPLDKQNNAYQNICHLLTVTERVDLMDKELKAEWKKYGRKKNSPLCF